MASCLSHKSQAVIVKFLDSAEIARQFFSLPHFVALSCLFCFSDSKSDFQVCSPSPKYFTELSQKKMLHTFFSSKFQLISYWYSREQSSISPLKWPLGGGRHTTTAAALARGEVGRFPSSIVGGRYNCHALPPTHTLAYFQSRFDFYHCIKESSQITIISGST